MKSGTMVYIHRKKQNHSIFNPTPVMVMVLVCFLTLHVSAITLTIDNIPQQQMKYGFDYERLWFWYGSDSIKTQVADWSVIDCDVDYLRVAIHCGYELEEGVLDPSAYDKILNLMTFMKTAKPDIEFFASPRPYNDTVSGGPWCPYPLWINEFRDNQDGTWTFLTFHWQKCAEYLIRYVRFMNSHGFKIHYMDLTNEFNKVTPTHMLNIKNMMAAALGDEMPKIIAPSAWSFTQGVNWLNDVISQNAVDAIDIAACHNTGSQGTPADFSNKAYSMGLEVWDSEMHGWVGQTPDEEIPTSDELWDRVRAGFTGIDSWLAIGTPNQHHCMILHRGSYAERNVKYFIFRKVTNTSHGGHCLDVNQPAAFRSTAAFIKNNTVTVWVLNNSTTAQSNVEFVIDGRTILSQIEQTKWHPSLPIDGSVSTFDKTADHQFHANIDGESLYCFSFMVNDISLPAGWASQDIGDVGAWGTSGYSNGTFRIDASGSDIWGTVDEFHYAYRPLSGNGQIKARVVSQTDTNPWAKTGVMIRETQDPDSKHAMLVLTPDNGSSFQYRSSTGGSMSSTTPGDGPTVPYWVKLVRFGDLLASYKSADGTTWAHVASQSVPMAQDVWIGLCVTSHNDGTISTAEFDSVDVIDTLTPDIDLNNQISFQDLERMSLHWQDINCYIDDWCDRVDLDLSNAVDITDLVMVTEKWLSHTDLTAPLPSPMTWDSFPTGVDPTSITMTATTATDVYGVEYYFECTAGDGHDSGWQDSPVYTDTGLQPLTQYTYQVKARDASINQNETGFSSALNALTYGDQWPYIGIFELPCRIEVEDYDEGGPAIAYVDSTTGNSGLQYRSDDVDIQSASDIDGGYAVWTGSPEWLEYTVTIPNTGFYAVDIRVASMSSGKTLSLLMDGQLVDTVSIPATGGSFDWQTISVKGYYLASSSQSIFRIELPDGRYNINWVEFRYLGDQWPYSGSPASVPSRIEAENFDLGGEGAAYHDTSTGNSGLQYRLQEDVDIATCNDVGGGYAVWTGSNEWLEYTLANTAGTFAVDFRVSSMFSGKTIEVYLDGQHVDTIPVPNTGSSSVWETATLNSITLTGPDNHILGVQFASGGFNLNRIELR